MIFLKKLLFYIFRLCRKCWRYVLQVLRIGKVRTAKSSKDRKIYQCKKTIQQTIRQARRSHSYDDSTAVSLELISLRIEKVPVSINKVDFIRKLNLSSNRLHKVKSLLIVLPQLKQLKELNLSNNKISRIPASFWTALPSSMKILDISSNHIHDLLIDHGDSFSPQNLHLEKINVSYNKLTNENEFSWIFSIPTLTFLDLCQNFLESLVIPQLTFPSVLNELHIDYNYLLNLPDNFNQFNDCLRVLSLSYNEFREFPKCILDCKLLKELVLSRNIMKSLDVSHLSGKKILNNLECLHIDNNLIRVLPEWVTCLEQLKTFACHSNQLKQIENLQHLPNLTYLDFHGNILERFPDWVLNNQSLHTVNCSFNLFYTLPNELHAWQVKQSCDLIYLQIPDQIVDGLFIGSIEAEESSGSIRTHKITHIIQVLPSAIQSQRHLKYYTIPIANGTDLTSYFHTIYETIDGILANNGVVLVHSHRSLSRSPAVVIAYLMMKNRISYQKAFEFVRSKRPGISINSSFQEQLQILGKNLTEDEH